MGAEKIKQLSLAKTIKQSVLSLSPNIGGIFAGLIVVVALELFTHELWVIALYPCVLSMRGVIGGLFSGRLSTGLHLGTIPTRLFGENTKRFHLLWGSIVVLAFESSILLSVTALPFGAVFWGVNILHAPLIFGTLIATMGLSLLAISSITIAISFFSFKKGLDPDIIVYPVESTVADVLGTLCYALVLGILFLIDVGWFVVLTMCIVFMIVVLIIFYRNMREAEFIRTIKEATYTLIIVSFIVNIAGTMLARVGEVVNHRPEIYMVYPALIDTIGDVGAIVGSTATTKLALGTIDPTFKSIRNHRNQIAGAWIASLVMYVMFALFPSFYQAQTSFSATLRFIGLLLATNVFATAFMVCISFGVAILTFRKGLDPDNFVIPIESTMADAITTIFLLIMLSLIGY